MVSSAFAAYFDDELSLEFIRDADVSQTGLHLEQLVNVESIHSSSGAFAAIKTNGSVITWGHALSGGDCRPVEAQLDAGPLSIVSHIYSSNKAFAALTTNGTVVTWGHPLYGGDSRSVQKQLVNVHTVHSAETAFAAVRDDGTVVTWGHPEYGGFSHAAQSQLRYVQNIHASLGAFVALTSRGKVATWGHPAYGGDSSAVQEQLYDILEVHAFGEVMEADVKMDTHTKRSKGFGFVAFANEALAEACLADPKGHVLDGKRIDVKRYGSTESGAGQPQSERRAEGVPQRGTQPSQAQRAPLDGSNPRGRGAKGESGRIRASGDDRDYFSGAPSQVEASRSAVLADIKWFSGLAESVPAEYLNEEYCISCSLPSARCGALIGRRGENINEVERKTGASVQLAKKNQADYRELTVTGSLISVYAAHLLLMRDYNEATRASEARMEPSAAEQKVQALERELASLKQQIPGRAMTNRSHR
eukprot:s167_g1.t1